MNVVIILTTTVNIKPTIHWTYQKNPTERANLYIKSIREWLNTTNFRIVLVEIYC
jgi:hypothetical protein